MVILKGNKVILRSVTKNDLRFFKIWRNAYEIWKNNTQFIFLNMVNQNIWFKSLSNSKKNKAMFTITDKRKIPIGICGLTSIDLDNKNAKIAIIIGKINLHSKGIGSESLELLLQYGFNHLKLHRIEAEIIEYNKKSIEFFQKFNFQFEIILHQTLWRKNKWWGIHKYSLIKN